MSTRSRYPMVPLGDVLVHYQEFIDRPEPIIYPKLSVRLYGKGVVLDTPVHGRSLRTKRHQLARAGQVILSEIWGKKGAIGIVPPEGEGALCTNHFFLFDICPEKLLPAYLQLIFTANYLETQLSARARGTTGYAAVRPKTLLSAHIPLPTREQQERIVTHVEKLMSRLAEAWTLRTDTARAVNVFWKELSRLARESTYPEQTLGSMVQFLDARRIPLSASQRATRQGPYPYYGASGIIDYIDDFLFDEELLLLSEDGANLLYRTTPIAFLARGKYWVNNHAHILRPLPERADSRFLEYVLSDYDVSIFHFASAQAKLTQTNARKIAFPLPPLSEQRRIVAHLDRLRTQAEQLKRIQTASSAGLDALMSSILARAFQGDL